MGEGAFGRLLVLDDDLMLVVDEDADVDIDETLSFVLERFEAGFDCDMVVVSDMFECEFDVSLLGRVDD